MSLNDFKFPEVHQNEIMKACMLVVKCSSKTPQKVTNVSSGQPQCPATHPNVYYNGQYCCLSDKEKVYPPAGETCDGSEIQRDSTCCEGDKFVRCLTGNCENSDSVERKKIRISGKTENSYIFLLSLFGRMLRI